jgi:hypothetical protein
MTEFKIQAKSIKNDFILWLFKPPVFLHRIFIGGNASVSISALLIIYDSLTFDTRSAIVLAKAI